MTEDEKLLDELQLEICFDLCNDCSKRDHCNGKWQYEDTAKAVLRVIKRHFPQNGDDDSGG